MQTKKDVMETAARGEGCLGKARDDEPVFVLVGDDATMALVVYDWAQNVKRLSLDTGRAVPDKVREAENFAVEITEWQLQNRLTVKIPD